MGGVSQSVTIHAPRDRVFAVITDIARYPEFLSEIRAVTIHQRSATRLEATFAAHIIVGLEYTLRFTLTPPTAVAWTMVKGSVIRQNNGGWKLKALSKNKTQATYTIDLTFGPFIPRQVTNILFESTLPSTLQRFKERIERE